MMKYKIKFVSDDILVDYDGMNYYAAKFIGFDFPILENEIFVNKDTLTFPEQISTIVHEIYESESMKGGKSYWEAHKLAAQAEKNENNLSQIEKFLNESDL